MKRAIFVRHTDTCRCPQTHEKVLSALGERQIASTATQILKNYTPDLILFSPSIRTRQAADIIKTTAQNMGKMIQSEVDENLCAKQLALALSALNNDIETTLFVTHEPDILDALCTCCVGIKIGSLIISHGTALVLESDALNWSDAVINKFSLKHMIRPL